MIISAAFRTVSDTLSHALPSVAAWLMPNLYPNSQTP